MGQARGRRDLFYLRGIAAVLLAAAPLAAIVIGIRNGWTRDIWWAAAAAVVGTIGVTALPTAVARLLRRPYEIWAEHEGARVRLFSTYDKEQFGQVARALIRAREATEA